MKTTTRISRLRLEQIAEALDDLESVFADPGCFGFDPRPVQDYAESLASEFVGQYRDDEITRRVAELIRAEDAGRPRHVQRGRSMSCRSGDKGQGGDRTCRPLALSVFLAVDQRQGILDQRRIALIGKLQVRCFGYREPPDIVMFVGRRG